MKRGLDDRHCSFCGKRKDEVMQIIRGPNVCICDECVKLSVGIITEPHPEWRGRLDSPCVHVTGTSVGPPEWVSFIRLVVWVERREIH
jgi:ClpX C4-type zinc finger